MFNSKDWVNILALTNFPCYKRLLHFKKVQVCLWNLLCKTFAELMITEPTWRFLWVKWPFVKYLCFYTTWVCFVRLVLKHFFSPTFFNLHNDMEERLEGVALIKIHRIMNTSSSRHKTNTLEFNKIRIPGTQVRTCLFKKKETFSRLTSSFNRYDLGLTVCNMKLFKCGQQL